MSILPQLKLSLQEIFNLLMSKVTSFNIDILTTTISDEFDKLKISTIVNLIEMIDEDYKNSKQRKRIFKIHDYRTRTLITSVGEITFKTTYYERKKKDPALPDYYCYILDILEIESRARMTNEAVTKLIDLNVQNTSIYAAKKLGVSKMTVSNKMRKINMFYSTPEKTKNTPKTIYIEADEKWIKKQYGAKIGNRTPSIMTKIVLIHEGYDERLSTKKRKVLLNKHYISSSKLNPSDFWHLVFDYLDKKYDLSVVENIFISSDGGGWIETCCEVFHKAKTVLDKFHCNKAMTYIFGKKKIKKIAMEYLKAKRTDDFNILVELEIQESPHKEQYMREKANYLINHIDNIINQDDEAYKVVCSMEGHVSHVLASRMASRPKAFCDSTIEGYVQALTAKANKITLTPQLLKYNKYYDVQDIVNNIKKSIYTKTKKIKLKDIKPDQSYLEARGYIPGLTGPSATSHYLRHLIK